MKVFMKAIRDALSAISFTWNKTTIPNWHANKWIMKAIYLNYCSDPEMFIREIFGPLSSALLLMVVQISPEIEYWDDIAEIWWDY